MRRGGVAPVIAALVVGIGPRAASAQRLEPVDLAVGGGIGVMQAARTGGHGYHGAASLPILRLRGTAHLRAELLYQAGTTTGSPFSCERVDQMYCTGRSDDNRLIGAAGFVRVASPWVGWFRFYFDPIGAGLYHRRTTSQETQGPTTICIIDGQVVSCPNNPPWATFEYRASRTSVGANTGAGMFVQLGGAVRVFAEARVHRLFESGESYAGAVPVSVGVSF